MRIQYLSVLSMVFICISCTGPTQPSSTPATNQAASQSDPASNRGEVIVNEAPPVNIFEPRRMKGHIPMWVKNANIYEINVGTFTSAGNLSSIHDEIPRIKKMGIDAILLSSVVNPSDGGSINTQLGQIGNLRNLVTAIQRVGIRVILDFPVNVSQPNQTNTSNMVYWVQNERFDGLRIDYAKDDDLWSEASAALTVAKPEVLLLSKSQQPDAIKNNLIEADHGTDFMAILDGIATGKKGPKDVQKWYKKHQKNYSSGWQVYPALKHADKGALKALAATLTGMPLIDGTQEKSMKEQEEFLTRLLEAKHINQALWNGEFGGTLEFMQVDDQILSFKKEKNGGVMYGVFNLSDEKAAFNIDRNENRLHEVIIRRVINFYKGTELNLEPWQFRIYSNT